MVTIFPEIPHNIPHLAVRMSAKRMNNHHIFSDTDNLVHLTCAQCFQSEAKGTSTTQSKCMSFHSMVSALTELSTGWGLSWREIGREARYQPKEMIPGRNLWWKTVEKVFFDTYTGQSVSVEDKMTISDLTLPCRNFFL